MKHLFFLFLAMLLIASCKPKHEKSFLPVSMENPWKYHEYLLKFDHPKIYLLDSIQIQKYSTQNVDSQFVNENLSQLDPEYSRMTRYGHLKKPLWHFIDTIQKVDDRLFITAYERYHSTVTPASYSLHSLNLVVIEKGKVLSSYPLSSYNSEGTGLAYGNGIKSSAIMKGNIIVSRSISRYDAVDIGGGWYLDSTTIAIYDSKSGSFQEITQSDKKYEFGAE